MSNLIKGEIDLYFKEDGDFDLDGINEDLKTTKDEEFRCFQQSIVMRMENSQNSFGMDHAFMSNNDTFFIETDIEENNIFAGLEEFHGAKLNNQTISLMKQRITNCLVADEAFNNVDFRVSVIKKSSTSVEILLMFRIPSDGSFTNAEQQDLLLHYRGAYNTYDDSFGSFLNLDFS